MDDQQEKSEQATPYKLEQARKKGNVAKSMDLLSFTVIATFILGFAIFSGKIVLEVSKQAVWWISHADVLAHNNLATVAYLGGQSLSKLFTVIFPLIFMLIVAAIGVSLSYSGFVFAFTALKPDLKRLDPVKGLKKIFSKRIFVEVFRVVLKGLLFFVVAYFSILYIIQQLTTHLSRTPQAIGLAFSHAVIILMLSLVTVMAAFALFDIWYAKREFSRQMRMSQKEVKDEHRHREGSPELKSRRRRNQQEFFSKVKAISQVKKADVVIINPTHYAVALVYQPDKMQTPIVLATGTGMLAHMIRRVARKNQVPILHRPIVARYIFANCAINQPIPAEMHNDVVDIYRWVIALPNSKLKF
ncbi:EscU/YscU/HrcU family type III secretion system export apparatus switch protein [Acinetobacter sp. 3657]|uniref:EscU/YscU/HrcU family type III secretion system export apparatus switch protein n=1 Tax=Acinetobacter sp. 3657 TaxID=2817764 RepID=UPI0028670482|nr:flagellar biosynthetic protein FlhB [Prolinoborus sp. 3657]